MPWAVIVDFIWHSFKRFASVILIAVVLVGGPYFIYRFGYEKGYKTGYAKSSIDNPTYTVNTGGIVNVQNDYRDEFKYLGGVIQLWKLRLKLGF